MLPSLWTDRSRLFVAGGTLTLLLPLSIAVAVNTMMWGYPLARPKVDSRAVQGRVASLTGFEFDRRDGDRFQTFAITDTARYTTEKPYDGDSYVLEGRVLHSGGAGS